MTRMAYALIVFVLLAAPVSSAEERVSELLTHTQSEAAKVTEGIYRSYFNSTSYKIITPDGSVVIDTGGVSQAEEQKAHLDAVGGDPVRYLILTHAHPDHVGGVHLYEGGGAKIIAHRIFPWRIREQVALRDFRGRRGRVLWAAMADAGSRFPPLKEIEPDILVDDQYAFELGGVRFEVLWIPGGEGLDGIAVWMPQHRAVFIGDLWGATPGTFPNLFTLRGENLREALPYIESVDRIIALEPEIVMAGHFEPLRGAAKIRRELTRLRDAVEYVHTETVKGMNDGKPLFQLMEEVKLPKELEVSQQYGRVPWGVRAIWELYTGWFRYESTTELYAVPPSSVYPELAGLAGGADALAERAEARVAAGEALQALHLCEIALAGEPGNRRALAARLGALQLLAREVGRRNFQEAGWLRHRIAQTEQLLRSSAEQALHSGAEQWSASP